MSGSLAARFPDFPWDLLAPYADIARRHPGGVIDLGRSYQGLDARWIRRDRLLDRAALLTWFGGMFRGGEKLGYTHHFATFNDTKIEMIEFLKK